MAFQNNRYILFRNADMLHLMSHYKIILFHRKFKIVYGLLLRWNWNSFLVQSHITWFLNRIYINFVKLNPTLHGIIFHHLVNCRPNVGKQWKKFWYYSSQLQGIRFVFLFIIYIYIYYQQAIACFSPVNSCALESISETMECVQFTTSDISSENMLEYITDLGIIFKV